MDDTDLSSSQDVVPDWRASKVDVEICEAALHTHETVPVEQGREVWILDKNMHYKTINFTKLCDFCPCRRYDQ